MNNNDTIRKTLLVAVSLCLVCSALISFSAVELRDLQEANKTLDKQSKILSAAGLLQDSTDVTEQFKSIDARVVDLETGLFDKAGFKRIHFAGHPEGNKDIDPDGSRKNVDSALKWKQNFKNKTDAEMAIATQFSFEAGPIIEWANSIKSAGIDIPIHIGIAGPAKLQTLIKFAIACGVGPSLKVLQKRATDVTKLLLPYEPIEVLSQLADYKANNPKFNISSVHFFPLGGIKTNAKWVTENGGTSGIPANQV